jgi:hypothetical protein
VYNTGKFFYYSNDPENVSTGLADNSLMLLGPTPGFPAQVSGSGRVFLWHANDMNQAVNTGLYIYNPDPNNTGATITVEATYGFVPGSGLSGVDAWFAYFGGQYSSSVQVPAKKFNPAPALFQQLIPKTGSSPTPYGVVADLTITAGKNPATATLYDLAWIKPDPPTLIPPNQTTAQNQAPHDAGTTRVRGLATNGYWVPVVLSPSTTAPTTASVVQALSTPQAFYLAGSPTNDSFLGTDLPNISGPTTAGSGPLVGGYGAQFCITWTVVNDDTSPQSPAQRTVTLSAGNYNVGKTNCAIYYQNGSGFGGCDGPPMASPHLYLPFLQDTVLKGTTVVYQFQIMTIGGLDTPLALLMTAK